MRKYLRNIVASLLIAFVLLAPLMAQATQSTASLTLYEPKLKAGLLYNFMKYTTWPQGSNDGGRLRVCLFGGDSFDGYLYPLRGRTAQQYEITITHVNDITDTGNCHLLFINRKEAAAAPQLLEFLEGKQILTASDIPSFAKLGGMVEFSMQDQRINVSINKQAVEKAGLHIHDRLLKLARLVSE